MDLIENIVESWFISKGYFVMPNIKIGVREVDLLVVKLDKHHQIEDAAHVEIQCSSNPIGYIGGSSSAKKRSPLEIARGVDEYIAKKFENKSVKGTVEKLIGKNYHKIFICGILKDENTIQQFIRRGVKVIRVWDIFQEIEKNCNLLQTAKGNRYHQLLKLTKRI